MRVAITHRINTLTDDELVQSKLPQFWNTETADQEARSVQIWNRKERFLTRKKYEETRTDHNYRTTATETLQQRNTRHYN